MRYIDEFRNKKLVKALVKEIVAIAPKDKAVNFMEVCGTHTMSFFRFGLKSLLPEGIRLISGPGCPVCVSTEGYLDKAIALAQDKSNIIVTFGDMLRVPGSVSSLDKERAEGRGVKIVYSGLDALEIARCNSDKNIIFLGVGFETTAPTIALTLLHAQKKKLRNFFILSSLRLIPPPMHLLAEDRRLNIQGFICPGHVSAIIGTRPYKKLAHTYNIGCVVAGFEPTDLLEAIYILLRQIQSGNRCVENQYSRVVKPSGNTAAQKIMDEVFKVVDTEWRGLGIIKRSGLAIREKYQGFDAEKVFEVSRCQPFDFAQGPSKVSRARVEGGIKVSKISKKCRCADILKGIISPKECQLFRCICNPNNPVGPCMVSTEGACNVYYKYERQG